MKSWAISRTRRWKGSLRMSSSVRLLVATDLTEGDGTGAVAMGLGPDEGGLDLQRLGGLVLAGAAPVDLRAVCLVRAMIVRSSGRE